MEFLNNFTETINFDDFSNSQLIDEFCKENLGLTHEELENLQISEKEQSSLNGLVSENIIETMLEPEMPQIMNDRMKENDKLCVNEVFKYLQQGNENKIKTIRKNLERINRNKIYTDLIWFQKATERLSYFNLYEHYCRVCKTKHKLTTKALSEKIMCDHQEKLIGELFRMFVDQKLKTVADLTFINLKHLNQEFLKLRDLTLGMGITSYTAIVQSANFVAEIAIYLLHQLKSLTKDDNRRILLAKYIYEIIKYINTFSFKNYVIRNLGKFRKADDDYLWKLFEYYQADTSETAIMNICVLNGEFTKNDLIELDNQIAKYRNIIQEFKKCLYDNLVERMKEIIIKSCSKRFELLFDYLFKEFTDDSKTYFVEVFNEDVWNKYSASIKLSVSENELFEQGKSFEIIVDRILEITKNIIQNNVDLIPNDYHPPTPKSPFIRDGLKYIGTYKYTKEDDILLGAYLETLYNFKRELFEIQVCDEYKSLIPPIYNENLTIISSLKTDENWLKYFKPKCFDDMRYGIYFYFRNNRDLAFSMVKYEKIPDLKLIPKNKLNIIKKIFNIDEEKLNEYILSLSSL